MAPLAARAAATIAAQSLSFVTSAVTAVAFGSFAAMSLSELRATSGNRDRRASLRERVRDRSADAGAAAGDQRMLAGERAHHTFPVIASGRDLSR